MSGGGKGQPPIRTASGLLYTAQGIEDRCFFAASLILELAAAGKFPHCKMHGYEEPLFRLDDSRRWIRTNLMQWCRGAELPKPVFAVISKLPKAVDIPESLSAIDGLKEISPDVFCGVYFLLKDGEVVYVGQSVRVAERLLAHQGFKEFDRVLFLTIPRSQLDEVERGFIKSLQPPLNKTGKKLAA